MSNPIPGKTYIVQTGDTLSGISTRAYGLPNEYPRIVRANNLPDDLIRVGETLIIPPIPELAALIKKSLSAGVEEDGFVLKLGNRLIPVLSGRVIRTMDTAADAWSCEIAWEPGADKELDKLTAPFSYTDAEVFLDGERTLTGRLYAVGQKFTDKGRVKTLKGGSLTIDIVDSQTSPPYQSNATSLERFCKDLLTPLGIGVKVAPHVKLEGKFKSETAKDNETIFNYLSRLAKSQGVLLSSTAKGELLITKADLKGPVVGSLVEGDPLVEKWESDFDGRKLFSSYRAVSGSSMSTKNKSVDLRDSSVPKTRVKNIRLKSGQNGDLDKAIIWERNKSLAKAIKLPCPVTSWYAPEGKLWRDNSRVTVESLTWGVPDGFTFQISRVEFIWDDKGKKAVLSLLPPFVYSNEIKDQPWLIKK